MSDLFEAPRPARLTLAQQALVNFMGCWTLEVFVDDRATDEALIIEWLEIARTEVPPFFDDVLQAADHIADCAARKLPAGHMDWWDALLRARRALIAFYSGRGVAAARAHQASQTPDPAPTNTPQPVE
jgi:hypothetical protein